jgi:hypothetical protein
MDLTQLEADLETALSQVISEESQLQSAIDAVKAVLPSVPVVDPAWQAVQDALVANGWSAPVATTTTTTTVPPV